MAVCLAVLSTVAYVAAQNQATTVKVGQPLTFSLMPGQEKAFFIQMKQDDFAEFTWLANDNLILAFSINDEANKVQESGKSIDQDSALFVAPKDGLYRLVLKFDETSELSGSQNISLEYKNIFRLPNGTRLKDIRKINGYDVKIMTTPLRQDGCCNSVVTIQKGVKLKKVLRSEVVDKTAGFYFGDDLTRAFTVAEKRSVPLIANTLDKTGDGVPDVLLHYFSGASHGGRSSFIFNLGETVIQVESIPGNDSIVATGKDPKGGLLFSVSDTSYEYWQIELEFRGSVYPEVILHFVNGKLRPDFGRMKKNPPNLAILKNRARIAKSLLSSNPYLGEDVEGSELYKENANFDTVFWSEMLDLLYSGNDQLAWQYLDLVWPPEKRGRDIFLIDFRKKLSESPFWRMIQEDIKK